MVVGVTLPVVVHQVLLGAVVPPGTPYRAPLPHEQVALSLFVQVDQHPARRGRLVGKLVPVVVVQVVVPLLVQVVVERGPGRQRGRVRHLPRVVGPLRHRALEVVEVFPSVRRGAARERARVGVEEPVGVQLPVVPRVPLRVLPAQVQVRQEEPVASAPADAPRAAPVPLPRRRHLTREATCLGPRPPQVPAPRRRLVPDLEFGRRRRWRRYPTRRPRRRRRASPLRVAGREVRGGP